MRAARVPPTLAAAMTKPQFSDVWARLAAHAGRPFLTEGGREFSCAIEGDALRLSHGDALLTRALLARAWSAMPCAAAALPAECKPRGYIWALLHDTRINGGAFLAEIPPALAKAAKTEEQRSQPKARKRRSHRAANR
ncbi:MAG: hypothetical protein ACREIA_00735 [Opitutaceae bacterium]